MENRDDTQGAVVPALYGRLLEELELDRDVTALTATLAEIEGLDEAEPQRAGLMVAGRQAIALRARLEEYQHKERSLRALFEVAQSLTELRNLDEVLHDIVRRSRQLLGCDVAWLAGRAGPNMRVLAIEGAHTLAVREMSARVDLGIAGYVRRTKAVFATPDYQSDPAISHDSTLDDTLAREGIRSALAAPLMSGQEVIGVLILAGRDRRTHQAWEKSTLATFAAQASLAIRNAEAFEAKRAALAQAEEANGRLQEQIAHLEVSVDAHDRIARQLSKGGGVEPMVHEIADLLGGEVIFVDPSGVEISAAKAKGVQLPARDWVRRRAGPEVLIGAEKSRVAGRSVVLDKEGTGGTEARVAAVAGGGELLGALILRSERARDDHEIRIFERGSTAMAVLALRAERDRMSRQQEAAVILRGLIEPGQGVDLGARARQAGLDLSGPMALGVFAIGSGRGAVTRRALAGVLRGQPHLVAEIDDRLVVLVNHADPEALRVESEAAVFGDHAEPGVGILSGRLDGAGEVAEAYRAALRGLDLLRKLGRGSRVVAEPDLSVYAILYREHSAADLARVMAGVLGPLGRAGAAKGALLAGTLLAFFDGGRNARATAERLGVHVNTVHNRIETAYRLLGRSPGEGPDLELHVALRLHALGAAGS